MGLFDNYHRDEVFVPGGQPRLTYVEREELHIERQLARAIATPNQIVSLSGPTKTGKTVLCRRVLRDREYVWIDGGQIKSDDGFWSKVCTELNIPLDTETTYETENTGQVGVSTIVTASGSRLVRRGTVEHKVGGMGDALSSLIKSKAILVIDDFHYIDKDVRMTLMRNVKGSVFNGLKVLLLSVTHRAFDAIKAESELTGRFSAVNIPEWSTEDLIQIPKLGFIALNVNCSDVIINKLAKEAQESPFLMQKFCWEVCYDCGIEHKSLISAKTIPDNYKLEEMFVRLAKDAGLPIYERLVTGPQSRKVRTRRPLKSGNDADIYEATLLAIAETGPKSSVSYEDLRGSLNNVLSEMMPQKHEITSALKHLANISVKSGTEGAIDWDEEKRQVNISDPYLRFFLRWQIRTRQN